MKYLVLGPSSMGYYSFLGALSVLDLSDLEEISGASAGALLGLLLSVGKTVDEIMKISLEIEMAAHMKMNLSSMMLNYGLVSNGPIRDTITKSIGGNLKFRDLPKKLHVAAVCLEKTETEYFSVDNAPDMSAVDAVLMSISLPFLIESVSYNGYTYVDGGMLEQLPLCAFLNKDPRDILALRIETNLQNSTKIASFKDFIFGIVFCVFRNRVQVGVTKTVVIDVGNINISNFLLDHDDIWRLFFMGRQQALIQLGLDK
jgi:NTE family protein